MKIVILGCGEFGAKLAELFQQENAEVSVIDSNPDAFKKLGKNFKGHTIIGSGVDREILEKANVSKAEVFVAAAGKDTTNLMAAQTVNTLFKAPRVIACIDNPVLAGAYEELNVESFCPTEINAKIVKDLIEKKK